MERKEFKQRVKGLFAWIFVFAILLSAIQGRNWSVAVEGAENTGNIPVKYYDIVYTEDGMEQHIPITDKASAGEGEAYFTSEGYTTGVDLDGTATSVLNSQLVFPAVEKDGYIFQNWKMGVSGSYIVTDMPEDSYWDWSGSGYTAATLVTTYEGIPFAPVWRKAGKIDVQVRFLEGFENAGSIESGIAGTYVETAETDIATIKLNPISKVNEGYLFVGWKCFDETGKEYITSSYVENAHETQIGCYPGGTALQIPFPKETGTTGELIASYVMEAQFVNANEIFVTIDTNDGTDGAISTYTNYRSSFSDSTINVTLPSAPNRAGYQFAGWMCTYDDEVYPAGESMQFDLDVQEVLFVAQWECEIPITYNTNGGEISSTNYDKKIALPIDATYADGIIFPTVTKENYVLVDWILEVGNGEYAEYDGEIDTWMWSENYPADTLTETGLVFTANWQEAITSVITYEYPGGMMNGYIDSYAELVTQPTIDSVDFEVPVTAFEPTKAGYMFTEWELQTSETGSGSYEGGKISGNYGENYTLVAKFRPENTISITTSIASGFEDAGTIDSGMAKTYGESIDNDGNGNALVSLPGAKEIADGYFFIGWKCFDANGKEVILDGYTEMTDYDGSVIECYPAGTSLSIAYSTDDNNAGGNNASYILEAQFKKAVGVNVVFDLNGGSGDIALNDTVYQEKFGDTTVAVTMPKAPVRDGFEFLGWKYNGANYVEVINVDVTLGEITLIADWKKVIEAGKMLLKAGQEYKLSEGNWTVDGDTTVYVGGSNFYVSEEAEYTFTKK